MTNIPEKSFRKEKHTLALSFCTQWCKNIFESLDESEILNNFYLEYQQSNFSVQFYFAISEFEF